MLYLDPPYLINQRLYGNKGDLHDGFDHKGLSEILEKRDNWILAYNDCEEIHGFYEDYTFYYPEWKYGMSNDKRSREVLIFSDDLAEINSLAQ